MADEQHPHPTDEDTDPLDLRLLATPTRAILTSAGRLEMRRVSSLGPLQRAKVAVLQARAKRADERLAKAGPNTPADRLEVLAGDVLEAEDELLRVMLVDPTPEQLEALGQPERVGIITAFFGATAAEAQRAVAAATAMLELPPDGPTPSPASSGSTAATPGRG
jgi:hypothetical protein